ncbi:glycoside hydrolase family 31 protein [Sphingomonas hengshuiensis]|uniref:Glycoside hydrolase family 31 n=1 Tax=Sphingomonas hengshuiensis TaxID=1609977 RepID=A0A7U4J934_9SPHN|nr:TIM-barrel domain-containing protein [Sphingomonas hengshuiensis]AJP72506.1 glycoside hydrolase family 31 [Sphingomonas hengshuiensis]
MITRRQTLLAGAAALGASAVGAPIARAAPPRRADLTIPLPDGVLELFALSDRAVRVRFAPRASLTLPDSTMLQPIVSPPKPRIAERDGTTRLTLPGIACEWSPGTGCLSFRDATGRLLLQEAPGTRRLAPVPLGLSVEQGFASPPDEHLFGTGCFQDGHLNLRTLPRRLTQVNTQISLPFLLSSKGYGLLWHNRGMSELNPPGTIVPLAKAAAGAEASADVTTATGNARVARREARFETEFITTRAGRHAFLLDIGKKMASRHHVEIDGKLVSDHSNLWLPPTTSFFADLEPGTHRVRVLANADDAPTLAFGPAIDTTVWRSPVAEAIDYVVIAGPSSAEILSGYRGLIGATPMMPLWALGYIHCRERFHSSDEILATAREFRARRLPVDMMVQDWQYWGKYGWNAMRFDEAHYPDPAALVRDLHGIDMRLMLSVWSKVSRDTDLGKQVAARNFYIPDTDWVDFFNPDAAAFYADNQNRRLGALGIDAWWQDATEPENDDLVGRQTAAGPGERVRIEYPLHVSRTVYDAQRRAFPDRRVMILTRSAFPGQQRYGAATWSGDIGNDWETLRRQIPAGLNMAAAGYAWWTVDAGGFFRPGPGQYTDTAYHERFLRWFQYATFLPLQRVHGYMTDTEFWRYGETVERVARDYLDLRYRMLPYTYSLAAEASATGMPLIRPLLFDFADDATALGQTHSYMFGPAFHVAPVLEAGAATWPVYLPRTPGGWHDFWTGEHREGGRTHTVPAPLDRIPLHVRAGSIVALGAVRQSTVGAPGQDLELRIYPGADGQTALYEDDGLTYDYETRGSARIALDWDDARGELTIGRRAGAYRGMPPTRTIQVRRMGTPGPAQQIVYAGRTVRVRV